MTDWSYLNKIPNVVIDSMVVISREEISIEAQHGKRVILTGKATGSPHNVAVVLVPNKISHPLLREYRGQLVKISKG